MKSQETVYYRNINNSEQNVIYSQVLKKKEQLSNKKWIIQKCNKPF